MPSVFDKLQRKDADPILVLDAPDSFAAELSLLDGVTVVRDATDVDAVDFVLAFVTSRNAIAEAATVVSTTTSGDATVWCAYPKATSKNYSCDFNRDSGWEPFGAAGFEPVRQVAIDADWSALRFRRVEFIKSLNRRASMALSDEGRARGKK